MLDKYGQLQKGVEEEMKQITLQEIIKDISYNEIKRNPDDEKSKKMINPFCKKYYININK